jgi:hypothetical protein
MRRPDLNNLPAADRTLLAELILQYATPDVVAVHWDAVQSGAHNDPAMFLSFHRNYIAGLETFLEEQGYPQFVPLPAWNPANPIPEEFNIPATGPDRLQNLDPQVSFSPEFDRENLKNYETVEALGEAVMPVHNVVHQRVGGVMNSARRAPEAPIFWSFHSFVDDIWWEWQRTTVAVPSCVGMHPEKAGKIIGHCGLVTVMIKNSNLFLSPPGMGIRHQQPRPLTLAPRGSKVKLFIR